MVVTHKKCVMHVSNLAWDILKVVKKDTLQILERNSIKFKTSVIHTDNSLTIQWDSKKKDNDDEIRMCAEVLTCYCYVIKDKELDEINLDQKSSDTQKWCEEIDQIIQMQCCVYVPEQTKVLVYCNTYDDVTKVKHHFLVKEGKMKQTHRQNSRKNEEKTQLLGDTSHISKEMSIPCTPGATSHLNHESAMYELLSSSEDYNMRSNFSEKAKRTIETYKTNEGIIVRVYEESITNLPVDCIVNLTDETLSYKTGVSKLIAEAAGIELKRELENLLEKNGPIPVGHACTTTAGQLPYKCVVHAVGPNWDEYRPHNLDKVKEFELHLYLAMMCSLYEAEKKGLGTIAFPPISAGISAEPEELCIYQYTKAVIDYSRNSLAAHTPLREVHIVDTNPDMVRKIQLMFKIMIQDVGLRYSRGPNDGRTASSSTAS